MASLEEYIAQELERVLDHQERGEFSMPFAERGLAIGGPDDPRIVLTVADVARIAVQAIRLQEAQSRPRSSEFDELLRVDLAERSTPESRAWAKRVVAEAKERQAQRPAGEGRRWLEGVMERARQRGEQTPDV